MMILLLYNNNNINDNNDDYDNHSNTLPKIFINFAIFKFLWTNTLAHECERACILPVLVFCNYYSRRLCFSVNSYI